MMVKFSAHLALKQAGAFFSLTKWLREFSRKAEGAVEQASWTSQLHDRIFHL